jgi:hypothetical protein
VVYLVSEEKRRKHMSQLLEFPVGLVATAGAAEGTTSNSIFRSEDERPQTRIND